MYICLSENQGKAKTRESRQSIINPDWNFERMGIGGLDKEFSDIFRRAFASRVFPPDIVEQMGELLSVSLSRLVFLVLQIFLSQQQFLFLDFHSIHCIQCYFHTCLFSCTLFLALLLVLFIALCVFFSHHIPLLTTFQGPSEPVFQPNVRQTEPLATVRGGGGGGGRTACQTKSHNRSLDETP